MKRWLAENMLMLLALVPLLGLMVMPRAMRSQPWIGVADLAVTISVLALIVIQWYRQYRRQDRTAERLSRGRCPHCGYDLSGNVSGICPECGTLVKAQSKVR